MDEKQGFSQRFKQALREAHIDARSPTWIATQFNLRHYGSPVSAQAVRKWLAGQAIPRPDKIRALARWLKVPAEWLWFGEGSRRAAGANLAAEPSAGYYEERLVELPKAFARLNLRHKQLVCELVYALLGAKK